MTILSVCLWEISWEWSISSSQSLRLQSRWSHYQKSNFLYLVSANMLTKQNFFNSSSIDRLLYLKMVQRLNRLSFFLKDFWNYSFLGFIFRKNNLFNSFLFYSYTLLVIRKFFHSILTVCKWSKFFWRFSASFLPANAYC